MNAEVSEEARSIWRRELAAQELWRLQGPMMIGACASARGSEEEILRVLQSMFSEGHWDADDLLEEAELYLRFVGGPESDRIAEVFEQQVRDLSTGKEPRRYVVENLSELSKVNHERLGLLESGLGKAKGYLMAHVDLANAGADAESCEAMYFFREAVPEDLITQVVKLWRMAVQAKEDRGGYMADVFWNSRDGHEEVDAVSHYRFIEAFGIGEFSKTLDEIEEDFRHSLLMPATWVLGARNLWLVSRSPSLLARMRPFAEQTLGMVCEYQNPEGWWPRPGSVQPEDLEPSDWTTALACAAILRTSRDAGQLERARAGARWLVGRQQPSGAWKNAPADDPWARQEKVGTTLLACEAIRNLDPGGFRTTLMAAEDWIGSRQTSSGLWEGEEPMSPALMTVQVIEHLERKRPTPDELGDYLSIARDFTLRAQEVAFENNPNAWRLAVVIAFQGLEAFLYGCFEHPSVNVPILEGRNRRISIGLRRALHALEESLRDSGRIEGQHVPRRNQLDRLAYLRDEVVHKGAAVSRRDAQRLTADAAHFTNDISETVFGFSIL